METERLKVLPIRTHTRLHAKTVKERRILNLNFYDILLFLSVFLNLATDSYVFHAKEGCQVENDNCDLLPTFLRVLFLVNKGLFESSE